MYTEPRRPAWWTEAHTSDWDRVKAALKRDWEQTKADFSLASGENLNQTVADTVMQAAGAEPLPPSGVKSHPSDVKASTRDAEKAREHMQRESVRAAETESKALGEIAREHLELIEKVSEARKELAMEEGKATGRSEVAQVKASDKVALAQDKAVGGIEKEHGKIDEANARRDEAIAKWQDAEDEVRYGYCVRSQYPATYVWDDTLEGNLRGEWEKLDPGMSWRISRSGIHRGWDFAERSAGR